MKKYQTVYSFRVLDEITVGEIVYVVDRSQEYSCNSIQQANHMKTEELLRVINHDNSNNRYEFYKIVESEDKTE